MAMNMETQSTESTGIQLCEGKSSNECFALVLDKLEKIHADVSQVQTRVTNLEAYREFTEESLRVLNEKTVPNLEEKIKGEEKERLKLENWGRKWNLVIRGVPGGPKETSRETDRVVRRFLTDSLKLSQEEVTKMLFTAVHRLPSGDEKKRNIIVRFSSLIDRDEVLTKAMKLSRGSGFSVTPDLAPETSRLRSQLLHERAQLPMEDRKKTKIIYIREYPFVKLVKRNY